VVVKDATRPQRAGERWSGEELLSVRWYCKGNAVIRSKQY